MRVFVYRAMLVFSIAATIGGVLTLIPVSSASYPNVLGYKSLCTFTPAATVFCLLLAGLSCFIRSALIKDKSGSVSERFRKHAKSFIPLAILAVIAIILTIWFADIKSVYTNPDTVSAPSETAG